MIPNSNSVKIVAMNFLKKRTSIGLVEPISLTGEAKCGGAVASVAKNNLVVNSNNILLEMMMS